MTTTVSPLRRDSRLAPPGLRRAFAQAVQGPLPVLVGVALIWLFFFAQNANFLSARNLSNLTVQMTVISILALGSVIVMVAGQIDLSIGSNMGLCAALMAVLLREGVPTPLALLATATTGLLLGVVQGVLAAFLGVPAFLITLGGFLAFSGVQLQLIGAAGEIGVTDPFVRSIANAYLPSWLAWTLVGAALVVALVVFFVDRRRWAAAGLPARPLAGGIVRLAVPFVVLIAVVAYFGEYFGTPNALVLLTVLIAGFGWILSRTTFGRDLYAVGGNTEAARRAGIPVRGTLIAALGINGLLAAVAAMVSASILYSVSGTTGGGILLLQAIAASVIGGASLFGGRGKPSMAIIGALVIVSISNGLGLLGLSAAVSFEVTGAILVIAVALDALARRRGDTTRRAR